MRPTGIPERRWSLNEEHLFFSLFEFRSTRKGSANYWEDALEHIRRAAIVHFLSDGDYQWDDHDVRGPRTGSRSGSRAHKEYGVLVNLRNSVVTNGPQVRDGSPNLFEVFQEDGNDESDAIDSDLVELAPNRVTVSSSAGGSSKASARSTGGEPRRRRRRGGTAGRSCRGSGIGWSYAIPLPPPELGTVDRLRHVRRERLCHRPRCARDKSMIRPAACRTIVRAAWAFWCGGRRSEPRPLLLRERFAEPARRVGGNAVALSSAIGHPGVPHAVGEPGRTNRCWTRVNPVSSPSVFSTGTRTSWNGSRRASSRTSPRRGAGCSERPRRRRRRRHEDNRTTGATDVPPDRCGRTRGRRFASAAGRPPLVAVDDAVAVVSPAVVASIFGSAPPPCIGRSSRTPGVDLRLRHRRSQRPSVRRWRPISRVCMFPSSGAAHRSAVGRAAPARLFEHRQHLAELRVRAAVSRRPGAEDRSSRAVSRSASMSAGGRGPRRITPARPGTVCRRTPDGLSAISARDRYRRTP